MISIPLGSRRLKIKRFLGKNNMYTPFMQEDRYGLIPFLLEPGDIGIQEKEGSRWE
jgi:hypothetical protein